MCAPLVTSGYTKLSATVTVILNDIERYKTRLVAKCYSQIEGIDYLEIFSHVKITTICVVLTITSAHNWHMQQLDINNAFLYDNLTKDVYVYSSRYH